jgi:hypothetical protein
VNGGRPGIDRFAFDHFCLDMCRCQDLCKYHAQVNLPDLAMCDAHTASTATLSRSRVQKSLTRSRALTEAHRVDHAASLQCASRLLQCASRFLKT